jgi:phospholipid/cholesterol/gamma-HCH transport system permease protein
MTTARIAAYDLSESEGARVLKLRGDWTVWTIADLDEGLRALDLPPGAKIDASEVGDVDVAGAFLIDRTLRGGRAFEAEGQTFDLVNESVTLRRLLVAERQALIAPPPQEKLPPGYIQRLEKIGMAMQNFGEETLETVSFFGETLVNIGRVIVNPRKMRWAAMFHVMESAGLNALSIIALLSFFIGLVIAFLGARVLQDFGATIYTVELVAFSVFREFGVVITAILLAGRTDSAFTAELGAMKMRQEIDALRVLGVDPMEALVVPRVLAMVLMTPVLTFVAVIAGLLGGMLVSWLALDVSPVLFVNRIHENVPPRHFWVGMMKAPVFALIVALVGCRHGLEVGGDVASLGKRVTASVVQAIFLVIVVDAAFALWFMELDW